MRKNCNKGGRNSGPLPLLPCHRVHEYSIRHHSRVCQRKPQNVFLTVEQNELYLLVLCLRWSCGWISRIGDESFGRGEDKIANARNQALMQETSRAIRNGHS